MTPEIPKTPETLDEADQRRGYILVVVDNRVQAELVVRLLEERGYTVQVACDGREALELVHRDPPALVVSDILMPHMDGFELTRQIRNNPRFVQIPILLLTELSKTGDLVQALSCGADTVVTKPYDEFLLGKVESLLANTNREEQCLDTNPPIQLTYDGQEFSIAASREKILEFLITTSEMSIDRNSELQQTNEELNATNEELAETEEELRVQVEVTNEAYSTLEKYEERFRISAQTLSDVIWDWDLRENRLDWHGRINEMLGYDPGEFPHTIDAWIHIIHPDDKARILTDLDRHITIHKPYEAAYRVLKKDGSIRFWVERGTALYDESGRAYRMIGSCSDNTERRIAEDSLRKSEEKYRRLFESAPVGIGIATLDGSVINGNRTMQEVTGYQGEELRAINISNLYLDPADRSRLIEEITQTGFVRDFEVRLKKKDGTPFDGLANVDLIEGEVGQVLLTTLLDVSELKKITCLVKASLIEKETLLREIHHRVKNNLQIISSLLSMQIRRIDHPETIEALRDSQSRVKTMSLVHEHLYLGENVSRIELEHYIRSLGTMIFANYQRDGKGIRFETSAHHIFVDINMAIPIGLITNELISNSLKYAFLEREQGTISITAIESTDALTLILADDGIGIWEIPPDTSDTLGLRLVKNLTRQLRGTMTIDRKNGTTFTLVIPGFTKPERKGADEDV